MFREASPSDQNNVVRIMNQAIDERRNAHLSQLVGDEADSWYAALMDRSDPLVVLESDGMVKGWGCLSPYRAGRGALANVAEITFYLDKDARGKGNGTQLIQYLEPIALEQSKSHLVAILLDDNGPSIGLLNKLGYSLWANFEGLAVFPDKSRGHTYMGKQL